MVLLALTVVVASLTVVPGPGHPAPGGRALVLLAAYLELTINPRPARSDPRPGTARDRRRESLNGIVQSPDRLRHS
ncbi:hypothetical protein SGLAM104S_09093 [Streptomyces glaucescens]